MAHAMEQCRRPWWKRPRVWFIGTTLLIALLIGIAVERSGRSALLPYTTFPDQLDAGNVASITLQVTEIRGHPGLVPAKGMTMLHTPKASDSPSVGLRNLQAPLALAGGRVR